MNDSSRQESVEDMRQAAQEGDAEALYGLGQAYAQGGTHLLMDLSKAIDAFTQAADSGHAAARKELSRLGQARPSDADAGRPEPARDVPSTWRDELEDNPQRALLEARPWFSIPAKNPDLADAGLSRPIEIYGWEHDNGYGSLFQTVGDQHLSAAKLLQANLLELAGLPHDQVLQLQADLCDQWMTRSSDQEVDEAGVVTTTEVAKALVLSTNGLLALATVTTTTTDHSRRIAQLRQPSRLHEATDLLLTDEWSMGVAPVAMDYAAQGEASSRRRARELEAKDANPERHKQFQSGNWLIDTPDTLLLVLEDSIERYTFDCRPRVWLTLGSDRYRHHTIQV